MDLSFFGLRSFPFEDRADAQFFYPTTECQEALAAMEYEIRHGTGLGLLIGEAGTGKTVLIRTLLRWLQKSDQTVVLTWPPNGEMDLIRECSKGFGVSLPSSHNHAHCLYRLSRHLGRRAGAPSRSILIVDQAENLSPNNMAQLETLAELNGERRKLLTIILAAQPLVRALLERPEFAWIHQQLFGERTLSPLTPKETGEYIRHRLRIAGAGDRRLFDDRAISLIHEISDGVPRFINRISNAAMLVAYAAQSPRILRTIVEAANDQGGSLPTSRPTVRERTIAARELGSAIIGEGGAPWMGVGVSPEPIANSDEPRMTPDPFGSSVASAAFVNHEESVDTRPDADGTSGASIVDGEFEGSSSDSFGPGPNKSTFLLARLEQAMARAERMTSTTDVSLSHLAAAEKRLASLVGQGERLTAQAHSQSAQLERACGAVRKVFTGLADATLQAQRQTEVLKGMGEDTTTRLAKLTAETERAAQMLHEWVEEAIRTQSRLERTLSNCPPIRQTHPVEPVRQLSRAVESFARIATEAVGGQLETLSEPDFHTAQAEPKIARSPTRTEEIARLISEAQPRKASAPS